MITSREYFSVVLISMNLYLYDELNYERNLIGTHDLLQDRCTDNAIDNNILQTNRFHVVVGLRIV